MQQMTTARDPHPAVVSESPMKQERLVSLDTFRGATIAGMILVNNPGTWKAIYWPLDHAPWHGWTPTDLIFPFFLFMVGLSLHFSRKNTFAQALRRGAILFALGLFLNAFPFFNPLTLRIPGVLQRIALCYLAAWTLFRFTGVAAQAVVVGLLLGGYWWLLTQVPVPGFGPANLEPGTNLAAYVDSQVYLGRLYMKTWDPEGLLSTLPATATTLLGVLAGAWLRRRRDPRVRAAGLVGAGIIFMSAGVAWGESFPINKNLWTSSYVLLTGGLASALFGLCYLLADVWGYRRWTDVFVVYGGNAILLYVAAALVTRTMRVTKLGGVSLHDHVFGLLLANHLPAHLASLIWALLVVGFWFFVLRALHRRDIHLRI